jgi:hypothetical protein
MALGIRNIFKAESAAKMAGAGANDMRIGILGSGLMGGKLGAILARAGHRGSR